MPVADALSAVLAGAEPLPEEMVALDAAHHRVLARDVADAVIIQEDTVIEGGGITITEAAISGRHIRPAGVDFRKGDVLLARGSRLADRDLSLAAGMNYPELAVHRRPKVAILATGDELVMPGSIPGPGQIVYSNGYALRAL